MPETRLGQFAVGSDRAVTFFFGAAMATGLAPFSLGPVAFGALIVLMWLMDHGANPRRAALLGWLAGLGYFGLGLHWIVEPFWVEPQVTGWMAPFALMGLAGGLALFWALASWMSFRLGGGVWRLAICLTLVECARGFVFTGFPWALISHIWSGTQILQWGALVGPYGLTLLTLLAAAMPLWAWRKLRNAPVALALGFGVWAALLGVGLWHKGEGAAATEADAPILRLVQPNAAQHEKWDPDKIPVFFNRMVAASEAKPPADLVIWPESSLPVMLEDAAPALGYIGARAEALAVIGLQRQNASGGYHNALALIDESGTALTVYDKHHLVPFGEYMPFPAFWQRLGVRALAERTETGYVSGVGPEIIDIPGVGRALALICYEAVFPRHTRVAGDRADFLMQLTNDAWFGAAVGPWQHLEQARMRAIEQGLPMVRVANTGVSGVLDGKGELIASLPLNTAGHIDVALPPALAPTLYARTGDAFVFGILLLLLALAGGKRIVGRFIT